MLAGTSNFIISAFVLSVLSLELPSLSHSPVHWKRWRRVRHFTNASDQGTSISLAWPTCHIPLKPNLVSFPNLKPRPSNRCHNWTILVHLLAFWVSFLRVVQAKKGTCLDMQTSASILAALATTRQTKGLQSWRHAVHKGTSRRSQRHVTSTFNARLVWNHKNFYGRILGPRTAV